MADPASEGPVVSFRVDDRTVKARPGDRVLEVCLANGIHIPNLCHLPGAEEPAASCRLCFVEVEGRPAPLTACTLPAEEGLVVRTDTPAVRRLQRSAFKMLMSVHETTCCRCPVNRRCELQNLARFLKVGLKPGPLPRRLKDPGIDESHPCLILHLNRCVLCGRCIATCRRLYGRSPLTFSRRGFETVLKALGAEDDALICRDCEACAAVCPTAAIELHPPV